MPRTSRTSRAVALGAAATVLVGALALVVTNGGRERAEVAAMADRRLQPTAGDQVRRGQAGPNLAVDPADEDHIVELHQELLTEDCEFNTSFDGGRTWKGGRLRAPVGYPAGSPGPCSVAGPGIGNIGQQSLAFGSGQNVYASWASTPQPMVVGSTVLVSRSTDGGVTFAPALEVPGMRGGPAPESDFSRPELVIERREAGRDRLYVSARETRSNRALVVRSDDGGATWGSAREASSNNPARNPPPTFPLGAPTPTASGDAYSVPTQLTQPVLGPPPPGGGERPLHLGWAAVRRGGPCPPDCEAAGEAVTDGYLVMATSTDLGQTWTRTRAVNLRGVVAPGAAAFRGPAFPRLAGGLDGALFVVFTQGPEVPGSASCGTGPFPAGVAGASTAPCPAYRNARTFRSADHTISSDADVWFLRSIDGGATWDGLRQVNDPKRPGLTAPEVTQTRHPQIAMASNGRIDIVWEDRRHWYLSPAVRQAVDPSQGLGRCVQTHAACEEGRLGDTYYAGSADQGTTFSANRRVNDRSHNNDVGFDYRISTYRDYGPNVVGLGTTRLLVADMDSRAGSATLDTLDIYLRGVDLSSLTGPIPVERLPTGADLSGVALSLLVAPGGSEAVLAGDGVTRPASSVVIVPQADPTAALVGGVLARAHLGALLASPAAGLPEAVKAEVDRLDAVGAYVLGDHGQLSPQVEADLAAAGIPAERIIRISGATPSELAVAVAHAVDARTTVERLASPATPAFDAVMIVNPAGAAAATASALAANRRLPVLFVESTGVPAATASALGALGISRTLVVGGPEEVGPAVEAALPGAVRLGGGDRYATSRAVLRESVDRGLPANVVYVADSSEPLGTALLGAAVGRLGGLLLLVPGASPLLAEAALSDAGLRPGVDRLVAAAAP